MIKTELKKVPNILETGVIQLDRAAGRREAICIEASADEVDLRLGAVDREFAIRNLEAESIQLREAREALERVQQGTYGTCVECEEPLSRPRLAALPCPGQGSASGANRPPIAAAPRQAPHLSWLWRREANYKAVGAV